MAPRPPPSSPPQGPQPWTCAASAYAKRCERAPQPRASDVSRTHDEPGRPGQAGQGKAGRRRRVRGKDAVCWWERDVIVIDLGDESLARTTSVALADVARERHTVGT